ncbi:hypothetical protein [Bradyrhizobium sp. SZCCHNRI1058]|uniref:hypothetical protein n=1 Tax=Bradyrhizobium sp. SZCCHNRI1058 TaxID=3057279 RepID=UPI00291620E5|nr:hypothetical protein [Bradyrhizobium sp. SZCCHNRI1058]
MITDKNKKAAIETCLREGFEPWRSKVRGKGSAVLEAGRRLKLNRNALTDWVRAQSALAERGEKNFLPNWSLYVAPANDNTPPTRREVHDSSYWRTRYNAAEKELAHIEKLLEEVGGIRQLRALPPEWLLKASAAKRARSVMSMLFTDLHMGEVVDPDEILGLNAFNPAIAERRAKRFFQAACEIGPRWASDTKLEGLLLNLGGDLVSGDIHEELRITNALTSHEQVRMVVKIIVAGIKLLLKVYRRIHVTSVPGNHARTTFKPTAKLYSKLSYDTLIAQMVADAFAGDARVTFQITVAPDAVIPVLGYTAFLTHGDKMGTGGGQGFAGPMLPIVRGTKKVEAQQARAGRRPDIIMHGHYHHSGNPGNVFANGAFPGYSEYGNGLRAALEPPQQWLFLIHETWGVRERCEIKLETPAAFQRVASAMPKEMAA